ncbi:MAG: T9SS type A sorting domain-containing protein, partial [Bacteroidia bacterium]
SIFLFLWSKKDSLMYFDKIRSVKAMPDGGCMIVGSLQTNMLDMIVIRYDKSGMITSVKYYESNMKEILIFPNPGVSKIFISGETQNRNFSLYDKQGKVVATASISQLTTGIDISFLSTGIYFYKITDTNSGAVKTGKWVKE